MKRCDLEKFLKENGYYFLRDSKHCVWSNGHKTVAIPHHKEINIFLAKKIMKQIKNEINELKVA